LNKLKWDRAIRGTFILRDNSGSVQDTVYTTLVVHQSGKASSSFESRCKPESGGYGAARVLKQRIGRHAGRHKSKVPYSIEHDSVNINSMCGELFHLLLGVAQREAGYRSLPTIENQ